MTLGDFLLILVSCAGIMGIGFGIGYWIGKDR